MCKFVCLDWKWYLGPARHCLGLMCETQFCLGFTLHLIKQTQSWPQTMYLNTLYNITGYAQYISLANMSDDQNLTKSFVLPTLPPPPPSQGTLPLPPSWGSEDVPPAQSSIHEYQWVLCGPLGPLLKIPKCKKQHRPAWMIRSPRQWRRKTYNWELSYSYHQAPQSHAFRSINFWNFAYLVSADIHW